MCFFLIVSNSELSNVELKQRLDETLEVGTLVNIEILMGIKVHWLIFCLRSPEIVWKANVGFPDMVKEPWGKTMSWPPQFLILLISPLT